MAVFEGAQGVQQRTNPTTSVRQRDVSRSRWEVKLVSGLVVQQVCRVADTVCKQVEDGQCHDGYDLGTVRDGHKRYSAETYCKHCFVQLTHDSATFRPEHGTNVRTYVPPMSTTVEGEDLCDRVRVRGSNTYERGQPALNDHRSCCAGLQTGTSRFRPALNLLPVHTEHSSVKQMLFTTTTN